MTEKERFIAAMNYQPADQRPLHLVGPWGDTLERWYREGLPRGADLNEYFNVQPLRTIYVGPDMGIFPAYETRTLEETDTVRIFTDGYGRTVRDFKDHTSMPEWIDFPVKSGADLQHVLDEHYQVDDLDARFPAGWEEKAKEAASSGHLVLVDGGCYYWTLRSLAGVEYASYLFYDAPEQVDELFERYNTVVMEGIRRLTDLVHIDLLGFGEDIAYKTGTLISPAMFREFILPRYRKATELARARGIEYTWYDSDGDVRPFIPDYLSVGIDTLAPCEVAASMDPVALRKQFGRDLRMVGGIDKREVAKGRAAIDAELAKLRPVIEEGGYIPAIDHSVSADISFADYCYFVEAIQQALEL
ncbi:MAG: uroporphyrinogen decarboxylase family protein [Armatimonadota bacterium]